MKEKEFVNKLRKIATQTEELEERKKALRREFFTSYPKFDQGTKVFVTYQEYDFRKRRLMTKTKKGFVGKYILHDEGMYLQFHLPRKDNGMMSITVHAYLKCSEIEINKL